MERGEYIDLVIAVAVFTLILSLASALTGNLAALSNGLIASVIIIGVSVGAKKLAARAYDATIRHELWTWERFGFKPGDRVQKKIPAGIILPILVSIISLGITKWPSLLTFEPSAKKGSKRVIAGYAFTEMTDWHIGLIATAGISSVLGIAFITYFIPSLQFIAAPAAYYAFANLVPFSKLDGAQLFSGSRVLWTALALVTLLFTAAFMMFGI